MREWDDVAALGAYLGLADAEKLAKRARSLPGAGRLRASFDSAAAVLSDAGHPDDAGRLRETLAGTDFQGLARQSGERPALLASDVYRRFAAVASRADHLPSPDVFDALFREYLRRFTVSARAILFVTGIRKEIISLEHPSAPEAISEISRLSCRSFGELQSGDPGQGPFPASMARYVQSLLECRGKGRIHPGDSVKILEMIDRVSAYPGYFRLVERKRKAAAARPLIGAIKALRGDGAPDQETADLIAALGLLLFNVFPSAALVDFIARYPPGPGNRFLQYEHNALLALNFLLMGKRAAAAGYCARARELAPDTERKTYTLLLEGCIALDRRDYGSAIDTLEKAMDLAASRRQRSLVGFYLGMVRFEAGDTGLALNCFREARSGAESDADLMAACSNMGTCQMRLGNLGEALQAFEEAASKGMYSGRGSVKHARSVAAGNAGIVYMSMREYDLAKEHFVKALRDARQTRNTRSVADQLTNIGLACKATGDYDAAASHFVSALNYACTIGYLEGVLYARDQISQVLALQGRHADEEGICRDIARRHPGIRNLLTRR